MTNNTLSANSLFHFTNNIDNLESILKNEFYPRYSLENWEPILGIDSEVAVPMVCFCDIPLTQIDNHTKIYGNYAIGLHKEWGKRNKINPIIYTYKDSFTAKYLRKIIEKVSEDGSDLDDYSNFLSYIKPYEGKLWKDNAYLDAIITFYDEREWRYIPKVNSAQGFPSLLLNKDGFLHNDLINKHKELESRKLSFDSTDIKYIIVNKENEIYDMVTKVRDFKRYIAFESMEILITRIISMEQIREDF